MDGFNGRLDEISTELRFTNRRIDRLLYTLVAGLFVVVAAVVGVGIT